MVAYSTVRNQAGVFGDGFERLVQNARCANKLKSCIPELPPSLQNLEASNSTSLQKYTHCSSNYLRMRFDKCFDLEKDARNEILRDFWLRFQFVAIHLAETTNDLSGELLATSVCIPGNEVPEWVEYSAIGSSWSHFLPGLSFSDEFLLMREDTQDSVRVPDKVWRECYELYFGSKTTLFHLRSYSLIKLLILCVFVVAFFICC